jgi:hypothetical protein
MKVAVALFVVLVFATVDARFWVGGIGKLKHATPAVQALAEEVIYSIYICISFLANLTQRVINLPRSSYVNLSHIIFSETTEPIETKLGIYRNVHWMID